MQPDQARLPFQYRRRGLKSGLVGYTECGAVFGTGAAAVVEAGGRNVGVTKPFRGAQGVRTEAPQINASSQRVFSQDAMVDGPVSKRPVGVPLPATGRRAPLRRLLLVVTREDLEQSPIRTLAPHNADQTFEQSEQAVQAAAAKYAQLPLVPLS